MSDRTKVFLCHIGSCVGLTVMAKLYGSASGFTDWKYWVGVFGLIIMAEVYGVVMQLRRELIEKRYAPKE